MKVILPLEGDSYNTHPIDELQMTSMNNYIEIGLTGSDRTVMVDKSKLLKAVKLVCED